MSDPVKLFIGGLSWNTSTDDLRAHFEAFGQLEDAVVIRDRETGRSRGFGFVTYASDNDANKAIAAVDGQKLDGREIRVQRAENRPPGGGFSRGGQSGGFSRSQQSGFSRGGSGYSRGNSEFSHGGDM